MKKKDIRIIIGCERFSVIKNAFLDLGFSNTYSCDILDAVNPYHHFKMDILKLLKNEKFHFGIFHPDCKYLCFSGERWMSRPGRDKLRLGGGLFLKKLLYHKNVLYRVVENSHSIYLNKLIGKPYQILQPNMFGQQYQKSTCLWVSDGVPLIKPTRIVSPGMFYKKGNVPAWYGDRKFPRDKTFDGMGKEMAKQYGEFLIKNL